MRHQHEWFTNVSCVFIITFFFSVYVFSLVHMNICIHFHLSNLMIKVYHNYFETNCKVSLTQQQILISEIKRPTHGNWKTWMDNFKKYL